MPIRALLLAALFANVAVAADGPTITVVRCARLLDVIAGKYLTNANVIISDDTITGVGGTPPPGSRVLDLSAGTCLPGLIDVHDHITFDAEINGYAALGISAHRATVTGVKNAKTTLLAGFTTIRNLGADQYSDVAIRDGIAAGDIDGPRMLVSGPALSITGGHCDETLLPFEYHRVGEGVADGPWAARTKVRQNVKYGADVIKVCASGGVFSKGDQPGTPQYTFEELQAIAEEAHKLGRKVAAHAHGTESIKQSILAGIDSIEHSSLIDDEGMRLAKEHKTFLVFDMYGDDYIQAEGLKHGMLQEWIDKDKAIAKLIRVNFRKAVLAGTRQAFGTDGGVYPHGDNWKQFPLMVEFGMKPIEAIRSATVDAAELLGLQYRAGVVAPKAFADIIAVDGDPLTDITTLGSVKFVMKGGKVYRNDFAK
jgi:imidazolonepropionase-like amidohydrolase